MEHAFNTNVAAQYDVNIAVLLHYFKRCGKNAKQAPDKKDWIEMSGEAFSHIFPFWSPKEIQSLISEAIELNALERKEEDSNFYALTPNALSYYSRQGD